MKITAPDKNINFKQCCSHISVYIQIPFDDITCRNQTTTIQKYFKDAEPTVSVVLTAVRSCNLASSHGSPTVETYG